MFFNITVLSKTQLDFFMLFELHSKYQVMDKITLRQIFLNNYMSISAISFPDKFRTHDVSHDENLTIKICQGLQALY